MIRGAGFTARVLFVTAIVFAVVGCATASLGPASSPGPSNGGGQTGNPTAPTSVITNGTPSPQTSPTAAATAAGSLSGTWNGQWANSTPDDSTGTFTMEWIQQGSALAGTVTIEGTPCLTGGTMTGQLNGDQISFGVVQGEVTVNYSGVLKNDGSMAGTYETTCGNAQGTWQATKQS